MIAHVIISNVCTGDDGQGDCYEIHAVTADPETAKSAAKAAAAARSAALVKDLVENYNRFCHTSKHVPHLCTTVQSTLEKVGIDVKQIPEMTHYEVLHVLNTHAEAIYNDCIQRVEELIVERGLESAIAASGVKIELHEML